MSKSSTRKNAKQSVEQKSKGRALMLSSRHSEHLPSKNALVVKSNKLVEASYNLTLQQLRLVHWLSRVVQEDHEDYKYYEIDVPLFLEFLNLKGSNSARDRIRDVTRTLQEKTILIRNQENGDEWEQFSWLRYSKVYRKDNRLVLRLSINPEMLPYIRDLKATFTKTSFYQITAFNSRYGWRFYEWCKQFQSIGWFEISLDELRSRLQIGEGVYPRFNNLRQRVINPAIAEICAVSDIDVVLAKTIKRGRSVHSLKFKITEKPVHVVPTLKDTEPSEENLISERLVSYGMPPAEAKKNVRKFYQYDREHLLNCVADVENKIDNGFSFKEGNPLIWLRHVLKNDQRSQSSLFVRSANSQPTEEEKQRATERQNAQGRIGYLEGVLQKVGKQYVTNRAEFVSATLETIDDAICTEWLDTFTSNMSPIYRKLAPGDTVWQHKLFRPDVDDFFRSNGITPLTYESYCADVGVDDVEIQKEISALKDLL